ncbi:MAG TPA: hypothetical protein VF613_13725 [Longimicrobium sp.]|jgi:hypothetical protein
MRTVLRLPILALLLLVAASCSSNRQPGSDPGPAARGATVRIQNNAWLDMNIYVLQTSGARRRLGMVNANATTTLRIPGPVVGLGQQLRFIVDPVGSQRTASSFEIYVRPDQQVTLTIPATVGR